eukprot:4040646-Pleurochrysis_carterae.AAC.2
MPWLRALSSSSRLTPPPIPPKPPIPPIPPKPPIPLKPAKPPGKPPETKRDAIDEGWWVRVRAHEEGWKKARWTRQVGEGEDGGREDVCQHRQTGSLKAAARVKPPAALCTARVHAPFEVELRQQTSCN